MTISLTSVAASTTPTVVKTFFKHYKTQLSKDKEDRRTEATDEFMFHEAFSVVKHFISIATTDTVESLQAFTNTYIPATRSTITKTVVIPLSCCNGAAKLLIENFGEQDLYDVVGGRKWWQIRGLNGVQAEWIFSRKDRRQLREMDEEARKRQEEADESAKTDGDDNDENQTEDMNRLQRCMLALHGGGYYFGSPNTHKQMFARFARKFGGRVFAVNYRKAPQYPWPCPLQDALAGYLYLTDPPPGAKHKAISPKKIVVCGDSAGGGLSLALLAVLRDLGRPMPAGAVLMSPWCDMTHSFPSILQNTDTDIIPKYGFIHKPSTLWPVPDESAQRAATVSERDEAGASATHSVKDGISRSDGTQAADGPKNVESNKLPDKDKVVWSRGFEPLPHLASDPICVEIEKESGERDKVELTRQIQLYATNSQVYHGLCSPILQGSLGGLPPLYILAGNCEVLRDEIIYVAHRAANPHRYPLRQDLLDANPRAQAAAAKFNDTPTKVHLQVYDGQPHVLTLFSFTTSARYAYRAIASFIKHVTGAPTEIINPFPNLDHSQTLHSALSEVSSRPPVHIMEDMIIAQEANQDVSKSDGHALFTEEPHSMSERSVNGVTSPRQQKSGDSPAANSNGSAVFTTSPNATTMPTSSALSGAPTRRDLTADGSSRTVNSNKEGSFIVDSPVDKHVARQLKRLVVKVGSENDYNGQVPLRRPTFVQGMIRERVDIRGKIRPLEGEEHLQALRMPVDEIGVLKAGPVQRYLTGQKMWDERFKRTAKRVAKQRAQNEERIAAMLKQASAAGLLTEDFMHSAYGEKAVQFEESDWSDLSRLGPLGLAGERPPPSAIAGRRDTQEALELFRQALHMQARHMKVDATTAAKVTLGEAQSSVLGVSRVKRRDVLNGVPWNQSAAERQIQGGRARYGLKAWVGTLAFLNRRKTRETRKMRRSGPGMHGRTNSGTAHLAATQSNAPDADAQADRDDGEADNDDVAEDLGERGFNDSHDDWEDVRTERAAAAAAVPQQAHASSAAP